MTYRELDRLSELATVGGGSAAAAFAALTGRTIRMEVPTLGHLAHRLDESGNGWTTGIFFELAGCLNAVVGVLFHGSASEAVVRSVVGEEKRDLSPHQIESALMEVGNILASHVASRIADLLGEKLLPSIPALAMNHALDYLTQIIPPEDFSRAICFECKLHDDLDELHGQLLLIPSVDSP